MVPSLALTNALLFFLSRVKLRMLFKVKSQNRDIADRGIELTNPGGEADILREEAMKTMKVEV